MDEPDDLLRASVILSVAAMDSYFTDSFCEILVPFLKKNEPTDKMAAILEKAGLDARLALVLLSMERPFRRIRTIVEGSFGNYTTQRTDVIDQLFESIGLADFTENAQKIVGRSNLKTRIRTLVKKRNFIAHGGDLNSHGQPRKIDADYVEGQISDLELFIEGAEKLIKLRLKNSLP